LQHQGLLKVPHALERLDLSKLLEQVSVEVVDIHGRPVHELSVGLEEGSLDLVSQDGAYAFPLPRERKSIRLGSPKCRSTTLEGLHKGRIVLKPPLRLRFRIRPVPEIPKGWRFQIRIDNQLSEPGVFDDLGQYSTTLPEACSARVTVYLLPPSSNDAGKPPVASTEIKVRDIDDPQVFDIEMAREKVREVLRLLGGR